MPLRIVVLSHHSLFADGIARRLAEFPERVDVHLIRSDSPSMEGDLLRIAPPIVILDAADTAACEKVPIPQLLEALPGARIVLIDPREGDVDVFSVARRRAEGIEELIAVMQEMSAGKTP